MNELMLNNSIFENIKQARKITKANINNLIMSEPQLIFKRFFPSSYIKVPPPLSAIILPQNVAFVKFFPLSNYMLNQ